MLRRTLTTLPLVFILYFSTSGGAFTTETLVRAVGPGLALLILLLVPLVYSIPEVLIVGELASMLPLEGGYYRWVQRAFGSFWAFQNGWLTWMYSLADMAIYPVLFNQYLAYFIPSLGRGARRVAYVSPRPRVCTAARRRELLRSVASRVRRYGLARLDGRRLAGDRARVDGRTRTSSRRVDRCRRHGERRRALQCATAIVFARPIRHRRRRTSSGSSRSDGRERYAAHRRSRLGAHLLGIRPYPLRQPRRCRRVALLPRPVPRVRVSRCPPPPRAKLARSLSHPPRRQRGHHSRCAADARAADRDLPFLSRPRVWTP